MDLKTPKFNSNNTFAANNWPKFKQSFNMFVATMGLQDNEKRKCKCNLLLHCMGPDGLYIHNTIDLKTEEI